MTTKLEQAQVLLESHGWDVRRPPFDDPYEVMFRRMMAAWSTNPGDFVHQDDDYMQPDYALSGFDDRALAFLKEHFVLKTELPE